MSPYLYFQKCQNQQGNDFNFTMSKSVEVGKKPYYLVLISIFKVNMQNEKNKLVSSQ